VSDYSVGEYLAAWAEVKEASRNFAPLSLADRMALCELDDPGFIERRVQSLFDEDPANPLRLLYASQFWLRPKQLALGQLLGGEKRFGLLIGGRGTGKTRPANNWLLHRLERGARELVMVGPTYDDVKQFMLGGHKRHVDGENGSGFLDILPPWIEHDFKEDEGVVVLPQFSAVLRLHSAETPEYRGPAPDSVWGDELIKWRWPERLVSNLRLACRSVGKVEPQMLFTTSPRPLKFLRDMVMDPAFVVLHATTAENRGNVHEQWYRGELRRLDGTVQGDEELGGELGIDAEGAIFSLSTIEQHRVSAFDELAAVVVMVDPAGTKNQRSDEVGVVAAGRAGNVHTGHGYVLADKSGKLGWDEWATCAVDLAIDMGATSIGVERDRYDDAAMANIRTAATSRGWRAEKRIGGKGNELDLVKGHRRIRLFDTRARELGDKAQRARAVQTLYQRGRMHHVGHLAELETQMTSWDPTAGESPGRLDALVHAAWDLFELGTAPTVDGAATMQGMAEANAKLNRGAGATLADRRAERSARHHNGSRGRGTL
jgi:phage terminase large subunit-like protein